MHIGNANAGVLRLPRRLNVRKNPTHKQEALGIDGRNPVVSADCNRTSSLLKKAFGYGICTVVVAVISFCWSFCTILSILWFLQWSHIPPKSQSFPVPLDFEPFRLVQNFPGESVYTLKNAPAAIRTAFASNLKEGGGGLVQNGTGVQLEELLHVDEDDIMFKRISNNEPSAVIGFADLELNISGILSHSHDVSSHNLESKYWSSYPIISLLIKPWDRLMKTVGFEKGRFPSSRFYSIRDFPIRIAIAFEYSNLHKRSTVNNDGRLMNWRSWFVPYENEIVNIRVTFYSENGQPVLTTAAAFFPEEYTSGIQQAARSTALSILQLMCVLLPVEVQSTVLNFPNRWTPVKLTLLPQFTFALDKASVVSQGLSKTRFAKVQLTPRVPVKHCLLWFESIPTGLVALLQDYPRILPITIASILSAIMASMVGLCLGSLSVLLVFQRYLTFTQ